MRMLIIGIAAPLTSALPGRPAAAWCHAGRYGAASSGDGSWQAQGYRGGSASGGDGSWSGTRGNWFSPDFGAKGIYDRVVPVP